MIDTLARTGCGSRQDLAVVESGMSQGGIGNRGVAGSPVGRGGNKDRPTRNVPPLPLWSAAHGQPRLVPSPTWRTDDTAGINRWRVSLSLLPSAVPSSALLNVGRPRACVPLSRRLSRATGFSHLFATSPYRCRWSPRFRDIDGPRQCRRDLSGTAVPPYRRWPSVDQIRDRSG